jgi:hypothetical protein
MEMLSLESLKKAAAGQLIRAPLRLARWWVGVGGSFAAFGLEQFL